VITPKLVLIIEQNPATAPLACPLRGVILLSMAVLAVNKEYKNDQPGNYTK
jgi:hypothetical protein